jgi:hypothetical protein
LHSTDKSIIVRTTQGRRAEQRKAQTTEPVTAAYLPAMDQMVEDEPWVALRGIHAIII